MPIYFVRAGDDGPVKIGISHNVTRRVAGMQTASAVPLFLLRVIDGSNAVEREMHHRFAPLRIRGEWFSYSAEMLTVQAASTAVASRLRPCATVREIIEDLGGQAEVSRLSGMSRTAVRHWYNENKVPHWHEQRFAELAKGARKTKEASQ